MRMVYNRRETFGLALAGGAAALGPATASGADGLEPGAGVPRFDGDWRRGFEGQRRADLGDGRFLNPLIAGLDVPGRGAVDNMEVRRCLRSRSGH
mgnify:FL=1